MRSTRLLFSPAFVLALGLLAACSCGPDADRLRIGAECSQTAQCENEELSCLTAFRGGYCGASGCAADVDCPEGARCVTVGATNYCFRECVDKAECNAHRSVQNESNCSSNITRVQGGNWKACVPPSSGL
jgi:hypothetical protein